MAKLYPRLEDFEFDEKIDLVEKELKNTNNLYSYNPIESELEWLPMGNRAEIIELKTLRSRIRDFFKEALITPTTPSRSLTFFDRELGLKLLEWLDITPSIAADNGMWAYLNIILIPDIMKLRWGYNDKGQEIEINKERYYDSRRSYLKSLWFAAYIIGDPQLYKKMNADNFVGWYERTSTRGYKGYINILYNHFYELVNGRQIIGGLKELFRKYVKLFNRKLAYLNYYALSEQQLTLLATEAFDKCISEIK